MTDKERLEENIKSLWDIANGLASYSGVALSEKEKEVVNFFIEQAKQMQELEQELHFCQVTKLSMDSVEKYTEDLKKQNKRYREVIKQVNNIIAEAIESLDKDEKVNGLEYAVKIINEALEGEE